MEFPKIFSAPKNFRTILHSKTVSSSFTGSLLICTCCGQRNTRDKDAIFGVPERFPSDFLPKELKMVRHFLRKQNEMKCSNAGRITLRAAAVEVSNTDLVIDNGWP